MHICIVEEGGFCFGVRRALEMAQQAIKQDDLSATLGPLIHNPQVVDQLAQQGVRVVERVAEAEPGETLMIRTHGCSPDVMQQALDRGVTVLDATCPFVARAQREAQRLCDEGWQVLILGEPEHPEARSIREHTGARATIVQGPDDLNDMQLREKVAVVCQTTQRLDHLSSLVSALLPRVRRLTVANTICDATTQRQDASVATARQVDVMIVVGGYHSANTTRLAQVCAEVNPRTHHIERAEELQPQWLEGARTVGITAGASTPDSAIEAVHERVQQLARGG
ncbi:MAG: 4-hydroxy-3-methylbut-2-enyl diphosphate reductase [candidate division WS1 bacterium]|nr:4-hydroxy-3-methylbut-2-enyl diphosphate reductase [candidate division WS1 bacterium]